MKRVYKVTVKVFLTSLSLKYSFNCLLSTFFKSLRVKIQKNNNKRLPSVCLVRILGNIPVQERMKDWFDMMVIDHDDVLCYSYSLFNFLYKFT